MRVSPLVRTVVLATAAAGLLGSSACIGSFHLTRKVYAFNKSVSPDKWVQELVFLAFAVVPVYSIASGLDVLVINSIEFWTGENPVMLSKVTPTEDGRRFVQRTTMTSEERIMILEEYAADRLLSTTTVRYAAGADRVTVETRYADGRTDSRIVSRLDDGSVLIEQ